MFLDKIMAHIVNKFHRFDSLKSQSTNKEGMGWGNKFI